MKQQTAKKIALILVLVLIGFLSASFVAEKAGSPETYTRTVTSIDGKVTQVLKLAASSALTSAGVSMIPGDTATPIAEKLADFSQYFLLVLCVLYTEKYLLTLFGMLTFRILIPLVCVLFIVSLFRKPQDYRRLAKKILIFGLVVVLAIPLCMRISDMIYDTYEASIEETLNDAEDLNAKTNELAGAKEDQTLLAKIWDRISESAVTLANKAAATLNRFIESLAVLIVTTCILPLLTIVLFVWLIKLLTGLDLNAVVLSRVHGRQQQEKLPPPEDPEQRK